MYIYYIYIIHLCIYIYVCTYIYNHRRVCCLVIFVGHTSESTSLAWQPIMHGTSQDMDEKQVFLKKQWLIWGSDFDLGNTFVFHFATFNCLTVLQGGQLSSARLLHRCHFQFLQFEGRHTSKLTLGSRWFSGRFESCILALAENAGFKMLLVINQIKWRSVPVENKNP